MESGARQNQFQSTHSLRSATYCMHDILRVGAFQSTHSLRSATHPLGDELTRCAVSIHALLAECDKMTSSPGLASCSFNPRTPCGVRRHQLHGPTTVDCFNPRIPCGVRHRTEKVIYMSKQFQSTHSLRSATLARSSVLSALSVSIHALLAECDSGGSYHRAHSHCFNPRTPCGVRPGEKRP